MVRRDRRKPTRGNDVNPEGIGDRFNLRDHPRRFDPHFHIDFADRTPLILLGHARDEFPEILQPAPSWLSRHHIRIIVDCLHRDFSGSPCSPEKFTEPLIRLLGFVVLIFADEAIENLAHGERLGIFRDDLAHLSEQD